MTYRQAIFIDVDGTLLKKDHSFTNNTKNAIQHLVDRNFLVVISTGRPPDAVFFIAEQLGLSDFPIVCTNGAQIYHHKKLIFEQGIQVADLKTILPLFEQNFNLNFLQDRTWYVREMDDFIKKESQIIKMIPQVGSPEKLLQEWESSNLLVHKFLANSDSQTVAQTFEGINKMDWPALNFYPSNPQFIEVMHKGSSKGQAMEWIMQNFVVEDKTTIAIGDGYNDEDMLQTAHIGIAMGNAPQEVKRLANLVTLSNEADGFSYAMQHFVK